MNVLAPDAPDQSLWVFKNSNKFPFGFKIRLITKNDKNHGVKEPIPWTFVSKGKSHMCLALVSSSVTWA